jgi:ribonuclease HI
MANEPLPLVTIFTDGGADPNPGPGGWGAVLLHPASGKTRELSGAEPYTTNNRMELTAAIRSLEALEARSEVQLFTDSQYLKKGITLWLRGWVARGWVRKEGELKNEDLWRRLAELVELHKIHWGWVKGHAGHRHNERADRLATAAMREQRARVAQNAANRRPVPERETGEPMPPPPRPEYDVFLRIARPGGRGGWAALIRQGETEIVAAGRADEPSANRLDLIAAIEALTRLPRGTSVAIHAGSDYLRNGASSWIEGWKRRAWKTQEGAPVSNRDLWQRLDAEIALHRVTWPDVKGRDLPELERLAGAAKEAALQG